MQTKKITSRRAPGSSALPARPGFSLLEVIVALALLAGVVLTMGMNTTVSSKNVSASGSRSRAQAMVDQQISRARSWPTYSTLSDLVDTRYNPTSSGLSTTTAVTVDTVGNLNLTTVAVTVTGSNTRVLAVPVKRSISIAAP
ncbi:MAG: prepilin-type N-terminal cleavage/methylation domain-containing protein [Gemmatimonadota bacterium]|nr:prepilin-type N-terminal cleavage/methylation domain-containing protein [Gemmatimonadota bacterium]